MLPSHPSSNQPLSNQLSSSLGGREFVVSGLALWQWREAARQQAIAATVPPSELDWFVQALTGLDKLALRLNSFKDQPEIRLPLPLDALSERWQQRVRDRVPVQYLVGTAPWRQFLLQVSPAVLIPRPETECLIDLAIAHAPASEGHWVDLGTGSGAIALGLATAFPAVTVHAVDTSTAALAIAQANAHAYGLSDHIRFYAGSWFDPLTHLRGQIQGLVSNPPYIPSQMVGELQPEVSHHEPHLALDGGVDGLDCIRHLIATAPDYLQPGGLLLFEMMAGQAIAVTQLLQAQESYSQIQIHADLAGIDRFALAYRI